jgi:hypothetical protein
MAFFGDGLLRSASCHPRGSCVCSSPLVVPALPVPPAPPGIKFPLARRPSPLVALPVLPAPLSLLVLPELLAPLTGRARLLCRSVTCSCLLVGPSPQLPPLTLARRKSGCCAELEASLRADWAKASVVGLLLPLLHPQQVWLRRLRRLHRRVLVTVPHLPARLFLGSLAARPPVVSAGLSSSSVWLVPVASNRGVQTGGLQCCTASGYLAASCLVTGFCLGPALVLRADARCSVPLPGAAQLPLSLTSPGVTLGVPLRLLRAA